MSFFDSLVKALKPLTKPSAKSSAPRQAAPPAQRGAGPAARPQAGPSQFMSQLQQMARPLTDSASVNRGRSDSGEKKLSETEEYYLERAKHYRDPVKPQIPKGPGARAGVGAIQLNEQVNKEREEKTQAHDAKTRSKRADILGSTVGETASAESNAEGFKTQEMTQDEYLGLTPRQRAAVDYNTLLTGAVERDLKNQDKYAKSGIGDDADYAERTNKLFGKDRGSDLYAPETMAVLSRLDLGDKVTDLDDYLGLRTAITADDIKMIDDSPQGNLAKNFADMPVTLSGKARAPGDSDSRLDFVNSIAVRTQGLTAQLAKGNELLQSVSASIQSNRDFRDDVGILGGKAPKVAGQLGFGSTDTDTVFQGYYDSIADKNNEKLKTDFGMGTPENILAYARKDLGEEGFASFLSYADTRSRNSSELKQTMGTIEEASYRKPDEFRKLLGLDG